MIDGQTTLVNLQRGTGSSGRGDFDPLRVTNLALGIDNLFDEFTAAGTGREVTYDASRRLWIKLAVDKCR